MFHDGLNLFRSVVFVGATGYEVFKLGKGGETVP